MNERLNHREALDGHAEFDHSVLAELIAWRWKEDRPYFTLNERGQGAWLEALVAAANGSRCPEVALVSPRPPQYECRPASASAGSVCGGGVSDSHYEAPVPATSSKLRP
jgi:hypothetical protein